MLLIRWSRLLVRGLPLALFFTLGMVGPLPIVLAFVQPGYEVAGMLVALVPAAVLVRSVGAVRAATTRLVERLVAPTDDAVLAVHREAQRAGVRMPTIVVARAELSRPLALRGLRWSFVLAAPRHLADPGALVDAVQHDRRWGDDLISVWLPTVAAMHAAWGSTLRYCTTAVRRGPMSARDRMVLFPSVVFTPVVVVWWALSWVAVQVAVLVTPRRLVDGCLELLGTTRWVQPRPTEDLVELGTGPRVGQRVVFGRTAVSTADEPPVLRTWWRTPRALAGVQYDALLDGLASTLVGVLLVGLATFSGFGQLAAQRVVWPWEEPAQRATVTSVEVVDEGGALDRIGLEVGVAMIPTVRLDDGREITLPEGRNRLEPGEQIVVVPHPDGSRARSTTQDATPAISVMGLLWVGAAIGMLRVSNGLIGLGLQRRLAQIDHEQRVLTGRRHRRRAPKDFLGLDAFRTEGP